MGCTPSSGSPSVMTIPDPDTHGQRIEIKANCSSLNYVIKWEPKGFLVDLWMESLEAALEYKKSLVKLLNRCIIMEFIF